MSETSLKFHVLPSGDIDCWLQVEGGPVQSFDPAQLPDKLSACLDALVVSQQVAVEAYKATIAKQVADLAALAEELDKAKGVAESQAATLAEMVPLADAARASAAAEEAARAETAEVRAELIAAREQLIALQSAPVK